jgi:hypothetical protein
MTKVGLIEAESTDWQRLIMFGQTKAAKDRLIKANTFWRLIRAGLIEADKGRVTEAVQIWTDKVWTVKAKTG